MKISSFLVTGATFALIVVMAVAVEQKQSTIRQKKGPTKGKKGTTDANTCPAAAVVVDYTDDPFPEGEEADRDNYIGTVPSDAILAAWSATTDKSAPVRGTLSFTNENNELVTGTFLINTSTGVRVVGLKTIYSGVHVDGVPGVLYTVECKTDSDTCAVFFEEPSEIVATRRMKEEKQSERRLRPCSSNSDCDSFCSTGSLCQCFRGACAQCNPDGD